MSQPQLRPMTEAYLQTHVIHAAKQLGWMVYHTWLSMHSEGGFSDLVLLKDGRMLVIELKSSRGTVTPAQQGWLDEFAKVSGCEVYVWKPEHWHTGEIVATLAGPAVGEWWDD